MIQQGRRGIVLALCALAFLLRAAGLGFQSLWRDEVDAIRFASRPLHELLRTFITAGENGPLYFLFLRPWLGLAGQSEFALRYLSALFGVLAVPLVYRLARRLFPSLSGVALVAALLTATSPYLIWYSQEGKMYTLGLLLVLLSMDRFLAAMEQGGWQRWLVYLVATSLAFYVHILVVLIVPVQVAAFFLAHKRSRSVRWKPWLVSLAVLTLPYLPLLLWQLPLLLEPAETGYQFVPLHQMLLSLLANYSLGVAHGANPWIAALFLTVLLAVGLHRTPDRPLRSSVGVLLCWLVLPVASFFLITLVRPLYTARYLISVLPAYLLLLAVGVVSIGLRTRLVAGLLLGTILVTSGWGVWRQASTPIKADFRTATRYVADHAAPLDLILFQIPYGRYSFDYYYQQQPIGQQAEKEVAPAGRGRHRVFLPLMAAGTGDKYRWAEGLYTNDGMDPHEVNRRMSEVSEGSHVVWLVATEASMWDGRGLVQGWLSDHATLTAEAQFVRVAVYRYELP